MPEKILEAIDEATAWMDFDGVEGIAEGKKDGKKCIVVLASASPDELSSAIPTTFKGFPVVIEESGIISAL
jgi:hypothetical protein